MRSKKGTVVSKSGRKTIVVMVHRYRFHPKYGKRYRISKKFHVHDEKNQFQIGDQVKIFESRPISKMKKWSVTEKK